MLGLLLNPHGCRYGCMQFENGLRPAVPLPFNLHDQLEPLECNSRQTRRGSASPQSAHTSSFIYYEWSYNLQSMVDFTFTFDMGSIFDTEGQTVKVLG